MSGEPPRAGKVYAKSGALVASPHVHGVWRQTRDVVYPRRGRPRGTGATELHMRWREMFESPKCKRECASNAERYRWVADNDWRQHPEDWPRDKFPASLKYPDEMSGREPCLGQTCRRIAYGIKAL